MERNLIVYFGIIQYEKNNAMCRHAQGVGKLIEACGYKPIYIGVSPKVRRHHYQQKSDDTYIINEPLTIANRLVECISSEEIKKALHAIGVEQIEALIMADFRFIPMRRMKYFCEKNHIKYIVNIMDRFENDGRLVGLIKKIDSELRFKILYPKIARRIYICSAYNELLGEGEKTAVIPGVTWSYNKAIVKTKEYTDLVFLGMPGMKCEKEKIDWIIKAVYGKNNLRVILAGFAKNDFLSNNQELAIYITDKIVFLGRITKEKCEEVLQSADFSLVVRPDSQLARYGFSTKIGEAFSFGIPVIATRTSDNDKYIIEGINGFLCECNYDDLLKLIEKISLLSRETINKMKEETIKQKCLDYRCFCNEFKRVVIE